ncbi:unnamed protein product [Cochlearia groenlandica]
MTKRRLGLIKKVSELTILCDVKACLIIFSLNEAEPMLFPPSADAVRDLLDRYFALPIIEQKKKETSLGAYLKNKTSEAEERLRKIQKKNLEDEVVKLMKQLRLGRSIGDFSDGEISKLLSFTKEKILNFRKRLDPGKERPPLREPLVNLEELKTATTTNDVTMVPRGHGDGARSVQKTRESIKKISYKIFDALRGNQNNYLMDQWFFPSPKPVSSQIRKEDLNPKIKLLDQGSGSNNGNPNLEMEPATAATAEVGSPLMNFHGLAELMTQQSQIFNESMVMAMTDQRPTQQQSLTSRGVQAREDISNNRNNDGPIRQQPPPTNEARDDQEGPIDINVVWPGTNNN